MPPDGGDEVTWHPEDTLLEGEVAGGSNLRVAVSFAFLADGQIIDLDDEIVKYNLYDDIELVAAVGNGLGRQGMFAQAVWFGEGGVVWKWMRINDIKFIVCQDDSVFRLGTEPCIVDAWNRSLKAVWPTKTVDVKVLPLKGRRPVWWFDNYKDDWPFDKSKAEISRDKKVLYLKDILGPRGVQP
ncbi:unnamed protein product [Rhizoctonia solani]|uniref:Uncharacterized protein n=1 Tax=Rhizoctonia solani TaxID=456999 RepID=A0A8H3H7Z9_9AGAM|nr:unnamed protein product [Rhizoctonia solani]